ncbi:hypothetical protein ACOSP7_017298 [Xanthoceras sorbifolium]
MQEEYLALMKNDTWVLEPPSDTCNIVGHKWVFRVEYKPDGSVAKYKTRLVAKGFHQTLGVDFSETYSPVIKPSTIRVIFTLAASFGWDVTPPDPTRLDRPRERYRVFKYFLNSVYKLKPYKII